jgi:Tol biopolymer transport system component
VSVDSSGAEANWESLYPTLSADGAFVAVGSSASNLVASDTNNCRDTFVRDRNAGTTERVSVDSSGAEGNSGSYYWTSISEDGRFVAFSSDATNLVAGDTNAARDVFVHDRQAGTTERVSVDSAGNQVMYVASDDPAISADGRFVAFDSLGSFDTNDTNIYYTDVYVHDRQNGKTKVLSVDANGKSGNGNSAWPSISAHGRYVAFVSAADDLVPGDGNGFDDVFVRDRTSGTTRRTSVDSSGGEGNWHSSSPSISSDGRFVAFTSEAWNLVAGDTNGVIDAFVHGPWLTLEADPAAPPAGATLSFTTWTGLPYGASLLVATDVNGTSIFVPVVLATFDSAGRWSWSATVPAGLSGIVASFTAFGFAPSGKVDASNEVDVAFQ